MYSSRSNNLFRTYDLDQHLRGLMNSLVSEIGRLNSEQLEKPDLNKELIEKYSLHAPVLHEDQIRVDARESEVGVRADRFISHYDEGVVYVKGLAITITIPFTGTAQLFECRPSTYSLSGTPDAQVNQGNLILNYETTEKDPEKIKQLWNKDISDIKQNLEWIDRDLTRHNSSLSHVVETTLASRKKEAGEYRSIIDELKQ